MASNFLSGYKEPGFRIGGEGISRLSFHSVTCIGLISIPSCVAILKGRINETKQIFETRFQNRKVSFNNDVSFFLI